MDRSCAAASPFRTRKLMNQYIEVYEYPDGRIELRANGISLPYRRYDRLSEIDQGAVVEHKRLSHVLQVAQCMQAQRDNRPVSGSPSRSNQGVAANQKKQLYVRVNEAVNQ